MFTKKTIFIAVLSAIFMTNSAQAVIGPIKITLNNEYRTSSPVIGPVATSIKLDKSDIKKTGATPLSNRAINYVFSSNSEIGFHSPSPYTKKSIDNVLSSTKNDLNKWITVKANVKEDFKRFHDLDVNELDGLAIMSDTDNSKMKSISYYQNIYFSAD